MKYSTHYFKFLGLLGILCVAGRCTSLPLDGIIAAEHGAATVSLEGCGNHRKDIGYVFCQVTNNASPVGGLILNVPIVECDRDSCVEWQLWRLDGSPGASGAIPKGEGRVTIPFAQIVSHDSPYTEEDEGEYLITVRVFYVEHDVEQGLLGHGFIRLNVLAEGYENLGCDAPQKAWDHKLDKKCRIQTTTGYRTAICGEC